MERCVKINDFASAVEGGEGEARDLRSAHCQHVFARSLAHERVIAPEFADWERPKALELHQRVNTAARGHRRQQKRVVGGMIAVLAAFLQRPQGLGRT